MSQPLITLKLALYPGMQLEPSLLDVYVTSNSILNPAYPSEPGTLYDGWCLDPYVDITTLATYSAYVYSSTELDVLRSGIPSLGRPDGFLDNLDSVNWLLNWYDGTNPGISWQEVQASIWKLMGEDWTQFGSFLGSVDVADINSMYTNAIAHDGYVPDVGDKISVVLDTYNTDGVRQQPIIIETTAAKLGDRVWHDADADGIQDTGEVGIGGATVKLVRDLNNDGDFNDANEVLGTTNTDTNGNYSFTGLTPGLDYQVVFVKPTGYDALSPRQSDGSVGSGINSDGLVSNVVVLAPGEYNPTLDSGFYNKASLGDYVWVDGNNDGQQGNAADIGLNGVVVNLYKGDGTFVATTTTANNGGNPGYYLFSDLIPGDYKVEFIKPAGYAFVQQDQGGDSVDSDANQATGMTVTTTLTSGENDLSWDAGLVQLLPGIDIEKTTNGTTNTNTVAPDYDNEDAANGAGVPILTAGLDVTWTYKVTNTGNTNFAKSEIAIVDDNGTSANTADDMSIANGMITYHSGDDGDNVLEAGEAWYYKASGTVLPLNTLGTATTIDMSGSSSTDGSDGNSRSYSANGVTVDASAWSREKGGDSWAKAWLGTYGGGLGVTDSSEGSGSGNSHTVDNNGRDNYIVFQFSQDVVVDKAFLGYVVGDSDMTVYVGSSTTPITGMNNAVLNGMTLTEFNDTSLSSARWADFNGGNVQGNVLILAARDDGHSMDYFKVEQLVFQAVESSGIYANKATVTADGLSDSDMSHYTVQAPVLKASIGDKVWLDCDADGIQDANEIGVSGVTVNLLSSAGAVLSSTTTDYQGNYLFSTLTPGSYAIQVVKPNGYSFTAKDQGGDDAKDSDVDTITGKTIVTTLTSGENDLTWDAGLTTVGACLDLDFSGNSASDGTDGNIRTFTQNGLSVNVSAFSRVDSTGAWATAYLGSYGGGLGVTDSSEGTGANNTHSVDNVGGRDNYVLFEFDKTVLLDKAYLGYVVNDSDIQVWIGNFNTPYTSHMNLSDAVLSQMGFMEVNATTLTSTRWADLNAGDYAGNTIVIAADTTDTSPEDYFKIETLSVCTPACGLTASLGDKVWLDANGNGVQDSGEAGIGGVTVKLLNSAGTVVGTATTNASGNYLFSNLTPGDYAVQVVAPTGYTITRKDLGGNDATDSDIDPSTGKTIVTTLSGGENDLSWDAGLYQKASIGDRVWCDSDKDGIQDTGEAGFSGVTVKLLNAAGAVLSTTTTDANGNYLFNNLAPGDYAVQVVAPTGYTITGKDLGGNDAKDSDFDPSTGKTVTTTLVSGENDLSWDAGLYQNKARIGDTVWEDKDNDGIQETGEAGIANVTVKLLNSSGTVLKTTTTNANGNYYFDVDAGSYKVQVVKPSGYYVTKQDQGSNDNVDSDINSSGLTGLYTITSGQQNLTVDAGLYKKASLGDRVWDDMNHNGLQDASEPGISGIKITLKTSAGVTVASTTTDTGGYYNFAGLNPGDYYMVFDKTNVMHYNYGAWYNMSNWKWASKDIGSNDAIDSDVTGNGVAKTNVTQTGIINLVSGENDMTWDAGITPIAIDLNGDGIQTLSRAASSGAFDLLNTGKAIQSGWLSGDDGFLAVDRNGNGRIDNISELFGGTNKGDGYGKLGTFDSNGDGVVDGKDAAFADLRIWQDANGNHQTDAGELMTLGDAGVASLSLAYQALPLMDGNGNLHLERGNATLADGSTVDMTDVYFGISAADVADAGIELPSLADLMSDSSSLDILLGAAEPAATVDFTAAAANDAFACGALEAMKQLADMVDQAAYA